MLLPLLINLNMFGSYVVVTPPPPVTVPSFPTGGGGYGPILVPHGHMQRRLLKQAIQEDEAIVAILIAINDVN